MSWSTPANHQPSCSLQLHNTTHCSTRPHQAFATQACARAPPVQASPFRLVASLRRTLTTIPTCAVHSGNLLSTTPCSCACLHAVPTASTPTWPSQSVPTRFPSTLHMATVQGSWECGSRSSPCRLHRCSCYCSVQRKTPCSAAWATVDKTALPLCIGLGSMSLQRCCSLRRQNKPTSACWRLQPLLALHLRPAPRARSQSTLHQHQSPVLTLLTPAMA